MEREGRWPIPTLPVFRDLCFGARGKFVKTVPASESGAVFVKYIPANSVRARKYPYKVPEDAVVEVLHSGGESIPGQPSKTVFLMDTMTQGRPLQEELEMEVGRKISKMRKQIKEAQWEARRERREKKKASDEAEQELKRREQRRGRPRQPSRQDRRGRNRKRRNRRNRRSNRSQSPPDRDSR